MNFSLKDKKIRLKQKAQDSSSDLKDFEQKKASGLKDEQLEASQEGIPQASSKEPELSGVSSEDEASQDFKQELTEKEKQNSSQPKKELKYQSLEEVWKHRAEKAEKDFMYLRAEFENYKKRALEEKYRLIRYSGESFISELATEVLDDLDRALFASKAQKSVEDLQKGLDMVDKKLKKLFEKFGVSVLDPKGEDFDPSYQEALSYIEKEDVPEDQVLQTYKKAYKLYDKVIRPAQVLVSKKTSKKDSV